MIFGFGSAASPASGTHGDDAGNTESAQGTSDEIESGDGEYTELEISITASLDGTCLERAVAYAGCRKIL